MTKYSSELKIEIVSKFFDHQNSMNGLSKKYNIPSYILNGFINLDKMTLILLKLNIRK